MMVTGKKARIFNVYGKPDTPDFPENVEFVQEGFSIFALIIPIIWAAYRRAWLLFAFFIGLNLFSGVAEQLGLLEEIQIGIIQFGAALYVALSASDWHAKALEKRGYELLEVVIAPSLLEAQEKFFMRYGTENFISSHSKYATL